METNHQVYFFHGTTSDGHRFTLAGTYDPEESIWTFGLALCNPRDQFNKKTGRNKAGGRLLTHRLYGQHICADSILSVDKGQMRFVEMGRELQLKSSVCLFDLFHLQKNFKDKK